LSAVTSPHIDVEITLSVRSLKPPYTFDKLRVAKKKEVIDKINNQLNSFETTTVSGSDKAVHALNAQILMQEVARKEQNRQACIMIVCTIAITFMTLAITAITVMTFVHTRHSI
jgi:t-SNARE complex subunit (syntaxin)